MWGAVDGDAESLMRWEKSPEEFYRGMSVILRLLSPDSIQAMKQVLLQRVADVPEYRDGLEVLNCFEKAMEIVKGGEG